MVKVGHRSSAVQHPCCALGIQINQPISCGIQINQPCNASSPKELIAGWGKTALHASNFNRVVGCGTSSELKLRREVETGRLLG